MANTEQEVSAAKQAVQKLIRYFGNDVQGKLQIFSNANTIRAKFHFLDAEGFEGVQKTRRQKKPRGTGCTVVAFTETLHATPDIYLRRDLATPGTLVHELIHFCTNPVFDKHFHISFTEGLTEYFTRQIYKIARQSYSREYAFAKSVVEEACGDESVARAALFHGRPAALRELGQAVQICAQTPRAKLPAGRPSHWSKSPRASVPRDPRIEIGRGGTGGRRS